MTFPTMGEPYKAHMRDWAAKREHTYFTDTLPNIDDAPEYHLQDTHPSISGHTAIAKALFDALIAQHAIPCK